MQSWTYVNPFLLLVGVLECLMEEVWIKPTQILTQSHTFNYTVQTYMKGALKILCSVVMATDIFKKDDEK